MQIGAVSSGGISAELVQIGARTTRSADLQVVTAEGDRVTISTESVRTLGYAAATGSSGGTRLSAQALQYSGEDRVSVTVEGDLSRQELVDLRKVIKAFERAAARGNATQFLERLSRPDLDTIASVTGSATTDTVVSVVDVTASAAPASADAPAPPPQHTVERSRHDREGDRAHEHDGDLARGHGIEEDGDRRHRDGSHRTADTERTGAERRPSHAHGEAEPPEVVPTAA